MSCKELPPAPFSGHLSPVLTPSTTRSDPRNSALLLAPSNDLAIGPRLSVSDPPPDDSLTRRRGVSTLSSLVTSMLAVLVSGVGLAFFSLIPFLRSLVRWSLKLLRWDTALFTHGSALQPNLMQLWVRSGWGAVSPQFTDGSTSPVAMLPRHTQEGHNIVQFCGAYFHLASPLVA